RPIEQWQTFETVNPFRHEGPTGVIQQRGVTPARYGQMLVQGNHQLVWPDPRHGRAGHPGHGQQVGAQRLQVDGQQALAEVGRNALVYRVAVDILQVAFDVDHAD